LRKKKGETDVRARYSSVRPGREKRKGRRVKTSPVQPEERRKNNSWRGGEAAEKSW